MEILEKFAQIYAHPPAVETRAPGRINLLGEHVDYNDGIVLPAAIDRHVTLAATPTFDNKLTLHAIDLNEHLSCSLSALDAKCDIDGNPLPGWALYPAGVAWSLQQAGFEPRGMQVAYTSDIPIGAGLSSSAAVEVAFAVTWQTLGDWQVNRLSLAQYCQRAENEYVGVSSGLMDQFASACGIEGHVLCFDTRSLDWKPYKMPPGTAIVIADSGIRRKLAGSAYNDRRAACEHAVQLLKKYLPEIKSLRDVSTVELAAYSTYLPPEIEHRTEHVVKEMHRVEQAIIALNRGDARMFGGFMFASHKSLCELFEVSIPELDILVDIARSSPGIYGARLTGAGFGGCTVNLVDATLTDEFIHSLQQGYRVKTGIEARVYLCKASSGAGARLLP